MKWDYQILCLSSLHLDVFIPLYLFFFFMHSSLKKQICIKICVSVFAVKIQWLCALVSVLTVSPWSGSLFPRQTTPAVTTTPPHPQVWCVCSRLYFTCFSVALIVNDHSLFLQWSPLCFVLAGFSSWPSIHLISLSVLPLSICCSKSLWPSFVIWRILYR